jgi:hypothetical protein
MAVIFAEPEPITSFGSLERLLIALNRNDIIELFFAKMGKFI